MALCREFHLWNKFIRIYSDVNLWELLFSKDNPCVEGRVLIYLDWLDELVCLNATNNLHLLVLSG